MNKELEELLKLFEYVFLYGSELIKKSINDPIMQEYSMEQFKMLSIMDQLGPLTPSEFVTIQGVHKSAISNRLKKLDEKGLIEFIKDSADQRIKRVGLSAAGKIVVDHSNYAFQTYITQLLCDQIEAEEIDQFLITFRKLKRILESDGRK